MGGPLSLRTLGPELRLLCRGYSAWPWLAPPIGAPGRGGVVSHFSLATPTRSACSARASANWSTSSHSPLRRVLELWLWGSVCCVLVDGGLLAPGVLSPGGTRSPKVGVRLGGVPAAACLGPEVRGVVSLAGFGSGSGCVTSGPLPAAFGSARFPLPVPPRKQALGSRGGLGAGGG